MNRDFTRSLTSSASIVVAMCISLMSGCISGGGGTLSGVAPGLEHARPMPEQVHAIWVARFHYQTPSDIRTIIRNSAQLGFNTLLWQVRGEGTVLYPSRIEPWAAQYNYRDPGFDPLRVAVEEAHRNNMRIEAWVNVMPGWKGKKPPPVPNQLWNTHPEWFLRDAAGQRQQLGDFYVILNPCLPAVRRYITDVFDEIVSNYAVDGVHLDYVRYAWDTTPNARERYPRDPETLALFLRDTGKTPDADPRGWDAWRINQLTRLVDSIRTIVAHRRLGATVTAATWSSPQRGYDDYFQNAAGWLRTGLIHAAYPMAYTDQVSDFEKYIRSYQAAAPERRIVPGLGIYKHSSPAQIAQQLERCRAWGGDFAVFSYASLHAVAGDRQAKRAALVSENRLRAMRRGVVKQF